ncbi:MAG TPA: hypothetical protein VGR50_07880 [Terriglobales bacterium]|nr:hypothetical protein [Terriglobales bacterium]
MAKAEETAVFPAPALPDEERKLRHARYSNGFGDDCPAGQGKQRT